MLRFALAWVNSYCGS